jgi:hypothetical protein
MVFHGRRGVPGVGLKYAAGKCHPRTPQKDGKAEAILRQTHKVIFENASKAYEVGRWRVINISWHDSRLDDTIALSKPIIYASQQLPIRTTIRVENDDRIDLFSEQLGKSPLQCCAFPGTSWFRPTQYGGPCVAGRVRSLVVAVVGNDHNAAKVDGVIKRQTGLNGVPNVVCLIVGRDEHQE